jgi:predicted CoA-binding protein
LTHFCKNGIPNGLVVKFLNLLTAKMTYSDNFLAEIFESVKTIAMVGASPDWVRPSHFAMKYLQRKRFRVIPVNPNVEEKRILGEKTYPNLTSIPENFEMVDIFRNSDAASSITDDAIELAKLKGIKVVWMQLDVQNDEAASRAEKAGLKVVMNRCPKIEFARLYGELNWSGVNTNIISAKRPRLKNWT